MRKFAIVAVLSLLAARPLAAASVYIVGFGFALEPSTQTMLDGAEAGLISNGHTVTSGTGLADYAGFDQVWDLRFSTELTPDERAAYATFMGAGGRMYLSGEAVWFDRNGSIEALVAQVGGGVLDGYSVPALGPSIEGFTPQGAIVNAPVAYSNLMFDLNGAYADPGNGFQVTRLGTILGWDFGDMTGAPLARLLTGFDIQIFQNGEDWTGNMATYLGTRPIPLPAGGFLLLSALGIGIVLRQWRCRVHELNSP